MHAHRCNGDSACFLHLNGPSSEVEAPAGGFRTLPSVYSTTAAPGFIMGTGNVGPEGVGLGDNDG